MVNPLFQIGGIASGLDTAGIIDQLMNIERVPVRRLEQSQASLKSVDAAWSKIVGKLSSFRSALDDVRKAGSISQLTTASSDNDTAVSVTSTGTGAAGSLSFTVASLATRHRVGTAGTFGSPVATLDAGSFTITDETGGVLGTVTTDGTETLADLVGKIDGLDVGVDAQVIKVSDSGYQLLLSATKTGANGAFSVSTDIASLGAATDLSIGADAHLKMGGLDIYRASNTIDDLIEGASIKLKAPTTSDVTVAVARDDDGVVAKVQALVDAANGVLTQLATDTSYNSETGTAGILQGDSLARKLGFDLRASLAQVAGDGDVNYISQIGVALTRDGKVSFDETKLRSALAENPAAVSTFLSESLLGSTGASLEFVGADAAAGQFTMTVSQAATVAAVTGAKFSPPSGNPKVFSITSGSGTAISVTIDEGMTAAQAVSRINSALMAAGAEDVRASLDETNPNKPKLVLSSVGYGSGASFTVADYGNDLDGTYSGTDIIADFGNGSVTGTGRSITGDGAAAGLTIGVAAGVGSYDLTFSTGLGGVLDKYLESLEGADGSIQSQRDSISNRLRDFDGQIEAFEERLKLRESKLRQQFTALESAMGRMQSQGQWLAGALGGLSANSGN